MAVRDIGIQVNDNQNFDIQLNDIRDFNIHVNDIRDFNIQVNSIRDFDIRRLEFGILDSNQCYYVVKYRIYVVTFGTYALINAYK